ncbi:hypothetical protein [uncultured Empedobacter sp.]|uniref:hypothetical protein n=1 Tax=uncultured Empedobacter sp. TaxID=410844 RepID=UPI0025EE85B3|nr:hypothetical protein [uncultured Empedobacter sp.]
MKKFISIVTVLIITLSISSCREAEELSEIPENNKVQKFISKAESADSTESHKEGESSNLTEDEGEPKKDKIKW